MLLSLDRHPPFAVASGALERKLTQIIPLEVRELDALARLKRGRRKVRADTDLVHERQTEHTAFILEEGWAFAYKMLPNGSRQVINFVLPGDFMGLRSGLLRSSDRSFAAVTDIVVAEISPGQMIETLQWLPRLGAAMLWAASRDEAILVEHLVSIGRRDALERTAHILVELGLRLEFVGLDTASSYSCPINQYYLADALGLTAIHVNRVLRSLRERGLVTVRDGRVEVHDLKGLRRVAGFHGGYLDQVHEPAG